MVIYADSVWMVNALIDSLMFLLAAKLCGFCARPWRCFLAGAVGGIYAVCTLFPKVAFLSSGVWKLIFYLIMAIIAYGFRKNALRPAFLAFACHFALAGFLFLFMNQLPLEAGIGRNGILYPIGTRILLLLAGSFYLAAALLAAGTMRHGENEFYSVMLRANGRCVRVKALLDTGHSLREPISGKAVVVLDLAVGECLFNIPLSSARLTDAAASYNTLVKEHPEYSFRLIPYKAVGISAGILIGAACKIRIGKREEQIFAAISPHSISDGGAYEALIGRNLI